MKLNNIILISILCITLSSCGVFTKVFKNTNKNKESVEVNVNKKNNTETQDNSIVIIKEKIDTITYTKPKVIESNISNIVNLKDIKDLVVLKDNLVEVKQTYDTLSKSLKTIVFLKSQEVRVVLDKITTIKKDIKVIDKSKVDSSYNKDIINKSFIKTKEPVNILWYILGVIGILGVGYYIFNKIKSYKNLIN